MSLSNSLIVGIFLNYFNPCLGFNMELLDTLKASFSNYFSSQCLNGYLLTTMPMSLSTPSPDSNWTHFLFDNAMARFETITTQTSCSLNILTKSNLNRTQTTLERIKKIRTSFTIVVLPDSQGLGLWFELATRAHSALVALISDTSEEVVQLFLICPFGPFLDYNVPFVVWRTGSGFTVDPIEKFKDSCHGIHGTWNISYVPFVPTLYNNGTNGTAPYGFEVEVAKRIEEKLGITFEYEWHGWSFQRYKGYDITKQLVEIAKNEKPFGIGVRLIRAPNELFADFTGVFFYIETFYGSRMPKELPNYLSAINVFSTQTWLSMILVNLLFSFALFSIHKSYQCETLRSHVKTKSGLLVDFLIRINLGLTEPERFRWFPNLCGGSVASGAFYFSTMVLCLSFTSTLLSVLVKVEREQPVDNSRDAWKRGATVYFTNRAEYVYPDLPAFKLYSEDLQKASLLAIETGGVYEMSLVSDIAKHAQRDIEDNGAVFAAGGARTSTTRITALAQNLYESKENMITSIPATFFVPKYAPWGPRVAQIQERLVSSGIVDHIAKKYVVPKDQPEDALIPLTLEHLASAWILLAIGYVMSTLTFIHERNLCKFVRSNRTSNYDKNTP